MTGKDIERAFTKAAGQAIVYKRFPEELLAKNPFLNRLTKLLDNGLLAGAADIPALEREFGHLTSLVEWLEGPGKPPFEAALRGEKAKVALR